MACDNMENALLWNDMPKSVPFHNKPNKIKV